MLLGISQKIYPDPEPAFVDRTNNILHTMCECLVR